MQETISAEDLLRDIYQAEAARRWYEQKHGLLSETFYRLFQQGKLRDEDPTEIQEYLEWAGWCEIYEDRRQRYEQAIEQRSHVENTQSVQSAPPCTHGLNPLTASHLKTRVALQH